MEKLEPTGVYKKLTFTMLDKGNPDCWKALKQFAQLFGVDWETMARGGENAVVVPLMFNDGTETEIRFYKANTRGDCRYSIPAPVLKAQAEGGDTIAFTFVMKNGQAMLCVNVTKQPEYEYICEVAG